VDLHALLALRWYQYAVFVEEVPMRNRLRELRAERGWSQAELADRLEVSRQSVNAIETGKYDPSLPLAFRLARLFAMRIEEIFTGEM
jgi:putative transcriptional regulator